MSSKETDWKKAQEARLAKNLEIWGTLLEEQQRAITAARGALRDFLAEYSENFDVSGATARALDQGFWKLEVAFRLPEKEKDEGPKDEQ